MKKTITLLLMLILLCTSAFAETVLPELDLLAYEFNASEDTIIAGSGEPVSEDTRTNKAGITRHFLYYDVQFLSQKWNLSYLFVDNKLLDISAYLDLEQADPSLDPTEMYNQACSFMAEILGNPFSSEGPTKIKDGNYAGSTEYMSRFKKDKKSGLIAVAAKDDKITLLQIEYYSEE